MTGEYRRPSPTQLFESVTPPADAEVSTRWIVAEIGRWRKDESSVALWKSVEQAEADGLVELFGVETFAIGDAAYRALFIVKTSRGGFGLFADGDYHNERADRALRPRPIRKLSRAQSKAAVLTLVSSKQFQGLVQVEILDK